MQTPFDVEVIEFWKKPKKIFFITQFCFVRP